ncbi:TIGR00725 family protein [Pseudolabrys sp. FHR47]|uniref:TIGR00725 family protein n=1 Tax=Pseudolabrys sp. FHR47 TaxID=2562284 RepID=UPI00143DBD90|nr:TIGR00725 family protein [Pseudolabrys sp. FHR47]
MRQPVAVIGPREASEGQLAAAEQVGAALARIGFTVVCGGRQGIMEAVCRGVAAEKGISIGLLPDTEATAANPYVTVPIATGLGEARNAIVARAGFCIVVIGDSYGTLSEVALGLQFGRPVFGLLGAASVKGVVSCDSVDAAIDGVCKLSLGLP